MASIFFRPTMLLTLLLVVSLYAVAVSAQQENAKLTFSISGGESVSQSFEMTVVGDTLSFGYTCERLC